MASSNSDPNKPSEDLNEGGVERASLVPVKVDSIAVVKATAIALVTGFASGAIAGIVLFMLLPEDISVDDGTIEIPIVFHGFMLLLGLLPSVIGGYLAATFAGRNFFFHAVVTGIVLLAIYGALCLIRSDDPFTLAKGITLLLTVPLAAVGGVIRTRKRGMLSLSLPNNTSRGVPPE